MYILKSPRNHLQENGTLSKQNQIKILLSKILSSSRRHHGFISTLCKMKNIFQYPFHRSASVRFHSAAMTMLFSIYMHVTSFISDLVTCCGKHSSETFLTDSTFIVKKLMLQVLQFSFIHYNTCSSHSNFCSSSSRLKNIQYILRSTTKLNQIRTLPTYFLLKIFCFLSLSCVPYNFNSS